MQARSFMLRIIAGKYRNRNIYEPDLKITRPTTNKIREAVFSSLQFKVYDKSFLDLFAGSGAMSIEASSREAKRVTAIEKNREVFKILTQNIKSLNVDNINYFQKDAIIFLENTSETYDFIYLDPPYEEYDLLNKCLEIIALKKLLNNDGEIIVETNKVNNIKIPEKLRVYKQKRYGKVDILYIVHNE
nr:16S rRNA (guanine(966)-N(2))-methyltransferase RsmD [Mycoplasma leonicaptivi]